MTKPSIGLWIDDPPKLVNDPAYWKKLKEHGVSTAAVMLETVRGGFDPVYSLKQIKSLGELARAQDIELVLTVWPEPRKQYLEDLDARIGVYLEESGAAALEFDAESNWTRGKVEGYPNLDRAGDAFVEVFQRICGKIDVRTELTTFTMHTENSRSADVAPHVDRLLPQAYSVRHRNGPKGDYEVPWDDNYGPGPMQKLTLDRALTVKGAPVKPKVSCGLAAYDQVWPGKKGEDAMLAAYEAALKYDPVEIRLWSSKWVLGVKANGYAARFLLSL
jgi:hypothetical protein